MDIKEVELKQQFYLSDEQYNTLKEKGSVVIDGETIEFDEGADYVTPDNTDAKLVALKNYLLAIINAKTGLSLKFVDTLPEATAEDTDTLAIYLVPKTTSEGQNIYDEYIVASGAWEKIGDTTLHTNCLTKEEAAEIYSSKSETIAAIAECEAKIPTNCLTKDGTVEDLYTTAKTIIGAINELKALVNAHESSITTLWGFHGVSPLSEEV